MYSDKSDKILYNLDCGGNVFNIMLYTLNKPHRIYASDAQISQIYIKIGRYVKLIKYFIALNNDDYSNYERKSSICYHDTKYHEPRHETLIIEKKYWDIDNSFVLIIDTKVFTILKERHSNIIELDIIGIDFPYYPRNLVFKSVYDNIDIIEYLNYDYNTEIRCINDILSFDEFIKISQQKLPYDDPYNTILSFIK